MKGNASFQQITLHPPLPCVYHGCDGEATSAIAYEVSEREWRMVPTCERHMHPIIARNRATDDAARREELMER